MRYILTTQTGAGLEEFCKVDEALGPGADQSGCWRADVGVNELGLGITTVWASKADSDRFTSERLFPAIRQVFGNEPGEPMAMVGYEATDELVIETTS